MKAITYKKALMIPFTIAALANAPVGLADAFSGALGAGTVNVAPTDVWGLSCPAGTASVRAKVTNPNGSAADEITVQVINPNGSTKSAISLEGVAPPTAILSGGAGNYLVTAHKDSSLVAVSYSITMDCYNASAVAFAGTQSTLFQNQ